MKNLLVILFGCFSFGQNLDSQSFNSQFNTNLDVLQREVARQYTPKDVAYYGNKYYYKEPQPAFLELFDAEKPLKVLTNYNLIDETFELQTDWKPLSISTDKVSRVRFKDDTFISLNGKFYKLLYNSEKDFKLLADTYLKLDIPHYQPGIQEKPDPTFKKTSEYYIYIGERLVKYERSKGFVSKMFGGGNSKKIKSQMRISKIKPKNPSQLGSLIEKFYEDLDI